MIRAMKIIEERPDGAVVELTKNELVIVSNAINEICHGPEAIEDWEFSTRVGTSRAEAEALLQRLNELS
jgi:hypothetical protein